MIPITPLQNRDVDSRGRFVQNGSMLIRKFRRPMAQATTTPTKANCRVNGSTDEVFDTALPMDGRFPMTMYPVRNSSGRSFREAVVCLSSPFRMPMLTITMPKTIPQTTPIVAMVMATGTASVQ